MVVIKSSEEVVIMRQAGEIVAAILQRLKEEIKPGIRTYHLDSIAKNELKGRGAKASFKGYRGYPAHLCVSVNDEIVHGIPGDRILNEGDIVSLDFGAYLKGFHADAAVTVGVGKISPQSQDLLTTTENALMLGIKASRSGAHIGDVSAVIQEHAESKGYSVVREYCGHGIGRNLHEDPQIPNFGLRGNGFLLQEGMTLALEPMVNTGGWGTRIDDNRWTVRTIDNGLSAHFEHTIAIRKDDPEILTAL